jgi:hypothetical protein
MAAPHDNVLDGLLESNSLGDDRAKELRDYDLSSDQRVSGPHPVNLALLVRVLNHRDLGDYDYSPANQIPDTLAETITTLLINDGGNDSVPVLTVARAMHALVSRPQTVFSMATTRAAARPRACDVEPKIF